MVRWIAPILSFTADEIWQDLPTVTGRSEFVFSEEFYASLFGLNSAEKMNDAYWQQIQLLRNEVNRVLEQARNDKVIGSALEAEVTLYVNTEYKALLEALGDELRFVLITSKACVKPLEEAVVPEGEMAGLAVKVERAQAAKCPRCWHYADRVGRNIQHPSLCARCVENVVGSGEVRHFA